jgi:hypothetical protein
VIVVLDANVLYPPSLRDLLLTLATLDAYDVRWNDEILDEVTRNVLADHPDIDPERFVGHTIAAMRDAFPDATVTASPPARRWAEIALEDRHVAATAIAAGAEAIVTLNVTDFAGSALRDAAIEVVTPGQLLEALLDDDPYLVVMAVRHLAARWKNPSRTPEEIVRLLAVHPSMESPMTTLLSHLDPG